MKNDLNDIVAKNNARLAKARHQHLTKKARSFSPAQRSVQVSAALGVAPKYVIDAITRAAAIGNAGR